MIQSLKRWPVVQASIALIRGLLRRGYQTSTIRLYRQELSGLPVAAPSVWQVNLNSTDDLAGYDSHVGWQTAAAFRRESAVRLARGERLFSITVAGTLAHYGWLIHPARTILIPEVHQSYELPVGAAYLYDFYTHPAYRQRGMYQASLSTILGQLQTWECSAAYIGVAPDNVASCRAIERLGFEPAATLHYQRVATHVRRGVQLVAPTELASRWSSQLA